MPVRKPAATVGPIRFAVRVRPGSSRTAVGGRYDGPLGPALIVAVSAPAVDGRANTATVRALATALRVRTGDLVLRSGAGTRDKLFEITTSEAGLDQRVRELRDGEGTG